MTGETSVFDQSLKPKRPKSREVSSRFLSPSSTTSSTSEHATQKSPSQILSPLRQKPRSSTDKQKHKCLENSGFMRGLWPSSTTPASKSSSSNSNLDTLGDHLKHDRQQDHGNFTNDHHVASKNPLFLHRQRSCTEFNRFENESKSAKENHKPLFGSSMRYTGKFKFPGKSTRSSSKSSNLVDDHDDNIAPGRFSVDENALRRKSFGQKSDALSDTKDSESDYSEIFSGTIIGSPMSGSYNSMQASYMAPTVSSRQYGIEVSSKYMLDLSSKSRRWSAESGDQKPKSGDNSPRNFSIKTAIKKANSFTGYGNVTSKLGLSPGRSSSPPVLGENKGKLKTLSSNLKPPSSPSRGKGVGNLISIGLELLKGKRSSSSGSSFFGPGTSESVHQLKLLYNRLVQWRYSNARAEAMDKSIQQQAESHLICAWHGLRQLQNSVLEKKLQLQKEKLQMKLCHIIHSQIRSLEAWGDMERQHLSALSTTKDFLHSAICRVPLVEGAKVEPHSTSIALRHASDLAASIKLLLSTYLPKAGETTAILAKLAEVVTQEKLLLEECLELFKIISILEIQERCLKCTTIQAKLQQQQHESQQNHF